jgi:hypothetical protein
MPGKIFRPEKNKVNGRFRILRKRDFRAYTGYLLLLGP